MTPQILAAGILPQTTFNVGVPLGAAQNMAYVIGINPVTVPQDGTHVLSLLLKIVSPSGVVMYKNTGYDAGDFSSPDSLTGSYVTPFLTGTFTPESGQYQINIKAQYVDSSGAPVTTLATVAYVSNELCMSCLPNPRLNNNLNCTDVLLTITDTTNYCLTGYSFVSVTREIDAVPPSGSNQPTATGTDKVLQIDNGSEGNGALWNGTYNISLTATATFQQGSTTIVQSFVYTTTKVVNCVNELCTINCLLSAMMETYVQELNDNPAMAANMLPKITAGTSEVLLAFNASKCGLDYQEYIDNFYTVTGIKKGCSTCAAIEPVGPVSSDCGCGGNSGGGGAPGQRGSLWYDGAGAPNNTLGLDNDQYLNTSNADVYWKVSGAWVLKLNIKGDTGAAGATGATGPAGTNGSAEFWDPLLNYDNTGAGSTDKVTKTILANTLTTVGDKIKLIFRIIYNSNHTFVVSPITIAGITVANAIQTTTTTNAVTITIVFSLTAGNMIARNVTYEYLSVTGGLLTSSQNNFALTAFDPTAANDVVIDFSAYSGLASALQLVSIESQLYKMP